ncbi:MAG: hypothetical protein ACOYNL_07285 [Rickettsiales bacterium]
MRQFAIFHKIQKMRCPFYVHAGQPKWAAQNATKKKAIQPPKKQPLEEQKPMSFAEVVSKMEPKMPEPVLTKLGLKKLTGLKKLPEFIDFENSEVAIETHADLARKAEDYDTAIPHVHAIVDALPMSLQQGIADTYMSHQRGGKKFVGMVEDPAVALENEIAVLRGEPIRANYIDVRMGPQILRHYLTDIISGILEVDLKPRTGNGELWTDALGKRTGRDLTA